MTATAQAALAPLSNDERLTVLESLLRGELLGGGVRTPQPDPGAEPAFHVLWGPVVLSLCSSTHAVGIPHARDCRNTLASGLGQVCRFTTPLEDPVAGDLVFVPVTPGQVVSDGVPDEG